MEKTIITKESLVKSSKRFSSGKLMEVGQVIIAGFLEKNENDLELISLEEKEIGSLYEHISTSERGFPKFKLKQ